MRAKANSNGRILEEQTASLVESILEYKTESYKQSKTEGNVLLKNAPYTSIYGRPSRTEFVLLHNNRRIRIECKAQHTKGSADEKLPYLMDNFKNAIPEKEAIIIIEGDGFKKGAKQWLKNEARTSKIQVMDLQEFKAYLENGLPKKTLFHRILEFFEV